MKRFLLLISLFITTLVAAQTNTWNGNVSNAWNNSGNWSLGIQPTSTHDVVIPTGSIVELTTSTNILSITLNGSATLTIAASLRINSDSSFGPDSTVNWNQGDLSGVLSSNVTLSCLGTVNLNTAVIKQIYDSLILSNSGQFNIASSGDFYVSNGIFNNLAGGTVALQADSGNISYSGGGTHLFNNYGTLAKTTSAGDASVICPMVNTGTISVESGSLTFASISATLNGGIYNVGTGTDLNWQGTVNVSGILNGTVAGNINWIGNVNVSTATLGFTGPGAIIWSQGALQGGGVLTNDFVLNLTSAVSKVITGATTLENTGLLNIVHSGDLYVSDGTFNNLPAGVIDMQADAGNLSYSGGGSHIFTNSGLIKRTSSTGTAAIENAFTNTGTISVESGILAITTVTSLFDGGTYNVLTDTALNLAGTVDLNGTLNGAIDGILNWSGTLEVDWAATFNFTGNGTINWSAGALQGGGVLTNEFKIDMTSAINKVVTGNATLNNSAYFNVTSSGDLYLMGGTLNNLADGIIDMQADSGNLSFAGGGSRIFNNMGLIRKTTSAGIASIQNQFTNTGTITVESGSLELASTNATLNGGTYNTFTATNLVFAGTVNLLGSLSGTMDGTLRMTTAVNIADAASFDFTGTTPITWPAGTIQGGGTLTNNYVIQLTSAVSKLITGNTTLHNNNTINIIESGDLYVGDGYLINSASGVIDLQADSGNLSYTGGGSHVLTNMGLIKKTNSAGEALINCLMTNTGTILAETGTIRMVFTNITLNGGEYNTMLGAKMVWDSSINISGTLTGTNDGTIEFINTVKTPVEATLSISGNPIIWSSGSIEGPGMLTNNTDFSLTSSVAKVFTSNLNLFNNATIAIDSSGDLRLDWGILTNNSPGIIDMKIDSGNISHSGGSPRHIDNYGLIVKSAGAGTAYIYPRTNNFGTVEVVSGAINLSGSFPFTNTETGTLTGTGTFVLAASGPHFVNHGTTAPGGEPGTLNFTGNYSTGSFAQLHVDVNGTGASDYDQLVLSPGGFGPSTVTVNLGYAAAVNDEFQIVTSLDNGVTVCNLPVAQVVREDLLYNFNTYCAPNNGGLILRVISIEAAPPMAEEQIFCAGATIADLEAEGQNLKWYSLPVGGAPLANTALLATGSYYVTQTINAYESARVEVPVTVNTTPLPSASAQDFTGSATVADLTANGTDLLWYDMAVGGSPLASSTALETGTYYVSQTLNNCESERISVEVTISEQTYPFYVDGDDDTYGAGDLVDVAADDAETPPPGYSLNDTDCDDNNASVWMLSDLYVDSDGDGYDNGMEEVCHGATAPAGYSMTSNGSDCDDNDASVWMLSDLYVDSDGDGYDSGMEEICHGATAPEGYSMTSSGSDCDDNDEFAYMSSDLYVDSDNDGYDSGMESVCHGATIPDGYALNTNGADCDDSNEFINPAATDIPDNGIDENCDGQDAVGNQITTTIRPNQCGATLANIYTSIHAVHVDNATAYRFRVLGPTGIQYTEQTNRWFQLTQLESHEYSTTYTIDVELQIDGVWLGSYGAACTVSTPALSPSLLNVHQCGQTLARLYSSVNASVIPGATGYRFRVTNLTDTSGDLVQQIDRTVPWFSLTQLGSYDYGKTYQIEVAIKTTGDFGDFGLPCTITTPSASAAVKQCGMTYASMYSPINAGVVPNVTGYRFMVTNLSTASVQIIDPVQSWINFSQVSDYSPGTVYEISVAVKTTGDFGPYGPACTITSVPAAIAGTTTGISSNFKAVASPNPFTDSFGINITSDVGSPVTLQVYDMMGKLLESKTVQLNVESDGLGTNYPSGVYNVVVIQDDVTETLRVIKR